MNRIMIMALGAPWEGFVATGAVQRGMEVRVLNLGQIAFSYPGISQNQLGVVKDRDPIPPSKFFDGVDVLIASLDHIHSMNGSRYQGTQYPFDLDLRNEIRRAGIKKVILVTSHQKRLGKGDFFPDTRQKLPGKREVLNLCRQIIHYHFFFEEMKPILKMAQNGRVYLFGRGDYKLNPIHREDLAQFILDHLEDPAKKLEAGGPDILTQNEIAELAFEALRKPVKITYLPGWLRGAIAFSADKFGCPEPAKSIIWLEAEMITPRVGVRRLKSFFFNEVDSLKGEVTGC